jgi:hypothetical protein
VGVGSYGRIKNQCKLTKDFLTLNPMLPYFMEKEIVTKQNKKIDGFATMLGEFEVPKP